MNARGNKSVATNKEPNKNGRQTHKSSPSSSPDKKNTTIFASVKAKRTSRRKQEENNTVLDDCRSTAHGIKLTFLAVSDAGSKRRVQEQIMT